MYNPGKKQPCLPETFFLFLFAPDKVSVLVGKLTAENLDKVDKVSDAEQTGRQRVENACANLTDIVAVDTKTAKEEAKQECCHPVLRFDRNLRRNIVLYCLTVQNLLHSFRHGVDIGATLR